MAIGLLYAVCFRMAAPVCEAQEPAGRAAPETLVAEFRWLAGQLRWVPGNPYALLPTVSHEKELITGKQQEVLRRLVQQAELLPVELAQSGDATERGLAVLVFGLSDSRQRVALAMARSGDKARTEIAHLPYQTRMYRANPIPQERICATVGGLAGVALRWRLMGWSPVPEHPFQKGQTALAYWNSVADHRRLPSEWAYRFRRAEACGEDLQLVKASFRKLLGASDYAVLAASAGAFAPEAFPDEEVAKAFSGQEERKIARGLLDGTWRLPGMTLSRGPNSRQQDELRGVLLRVAPHVLGREDAEWLRKAADKERDWLKVRYVIAAARLDPARGGAWLTDAIPSERSQSARCELLAALWSVGGAHYLAKIADAYYGDPKPEYNAGGLQEDLIRRVGAGSDRQARALLAALIQDDRFRSLSWIPTRGFAVHAEQVLGKKTAEAKRYLRVEHRMGRYEYEMRPELRKNFPVDTKHVQMQTKAFQEYLQAEVKRRQGT